MACVYDLSSNIGTLCRIDHTWNLKCKYALKQNKCPRYKEYNFNNVIKLEKPKEIKDRTNEAYELYWQGVNPREIEDIELRERLIQIINSEERANENWREYVK